MGTKGVAQAGKAAGRKGALADFANTSASVVHTAAEILEKEIAAGIKAAQEVSARMEMAAGKSPDPTNASFLEIVDRFEKDAQEAVSVLATLFRTLAKAVESTTARGPKPDTQQD